MPEQPETISDTKARLEVYAEETNLVSKVSDAKLAELSSRVAGDYEIDETSRSAWIKDYDDAMKLVNMVGAGSPGAADVKYPLIATAAIQFTARALPAIIQGTSVVKGRVVGKDKSGEKASQAERVGEHMSYQVLVEMIDWVVDLERLLTSMAITVTEFKKTWYDPIVGHPVSEFVSAKNVVVNNSAKSLERAPRITHVFELYPHEIEERIRGGRFIEFDYGGQTGKDTADYDSPHVFLEQHRRWDIDDDGYPEPVITTIHKTTGKVVRITARFDTHGIHVDNHDRVVMIEPIMYFTKFGFLRSFDGSFYDIGFGKLLSHNNETINTIINQLLDAARDQITGGGLIAGDVNIKSGKIGGAITFKKGEWKLVSMSGDDIRKRIWPRETAQPSAVSFTLLEFLLSASEKLASNPDVLSGTPPPANTPLGTTITMVREGLKVFGAIYGRIHRSLTQEFRKIYRLNRLYLDDEVYFRVMDDEKAVKRTDYDDESCDVVPVSDPNNVTDSQKILKAEALMQVLGKGLNDDVIKRRYLEALQIEDVEELMPDKDAAAAPPPDVQLEIDKLAIEKEKLAIDRERLEIEKSTAKYESIRIRADALRMIAEAESKEVGTQMETYKAQIRDLEAEIWISKGGIGDGQKDVGGMVGTPGNGGISSGGEPVETAGVEPIGVGSDIEL